MNIKEINKYLEDGMSVKDVRIKLEIGEKNFQKQIKELGYKYNQKSKRYVKIGKDYDSNTLVTPKEIKNDYDNNTTVISEESKDNYDSNTTVIQKTKQGDYDNNTVVTKHKNYTKVSNSYNFSDLDLSKMVNLIKYSSDIMDMLEWFKNKEYENTIVEVKSNNSINIDLSPEYKRTSILVNKKVYDKFDEFCEKHKEFAKKDLLSMAIKEYITKYE